MNPLQMNDEQRQPRVKIPEKTELVPTKPDTQTAQHQKDLQDAQLESFKQGIELKAKFSFRIFLLVIIWLAVVLLIIVFNGYGAWGFSLSDSVVITLIGSTTANILGLLVIVLKYVFSAHKLDLQ